MHQTSQYLPPFDRPPFPLELLLMILNHVKNQRKSPERTKTLKSLALASSGLSQIVTPLLFRSAKWGNLNEYRAQARFYSLKPSREPQFYPREDQKAGKKSTKNKSVELASFIEKLDVFLELPPSKPGADWIREKRISDFKELSAIDKFPSFENVTELNVRSRGQEEIREWLAEIVRLLSPKVTKLDLDLNSFFELFSVGKEVLKKEINDEEWPELTHLTISIHQTESIQDYRLTSFHERLFRVYSHVLLVLARPSDPLIKRTLRLDFGSVFHRSTLIYLETLLCSIFGATTESLDETVGKRIKELGLTLCLTGGLGISGSVSGSTRAELLERKLFTLEGDLATRSLEEFRDLQLLNADLVD